MNRCKWTTLTAAAFMAATLAACDKTGPSLIKDEEINAELATSEGDAMALAVLTLNGNASDASLGGAPAPGESNVTDNSGGHNGRPIRDVETVTPHIHRRHAQPDPQD